MEIKKEKIEKTIKDAFYNFPNRAIVSIIIFYISFNILLFSSGRILAILVKERIKLAFHFNMNAYFSFLLILCLINSIIIYLFVSEDILLYTKSKFIFYFDKVENKYPVWMLRIIYIILILILSNLSIDMMKGFYFLKNINLNLINIFLNLINVIITFFVFENSDLGILIFDSHKLLNDFLNDNPHTDFSKIFSTKNLMLGIEGTNIGKKSGTFKFLGICNLDERKEIKKSGNLVSKLKQPKFLKLKDNKLIDDYKTRFNLSSGETFEPHYLEFPKNITDDFYLIFLKEPNKLIFYRVFKPRTDKRFFLKHKCVLVYFIFLVFLELFTIYKYPKFNILSTFSNRIVLNNRNYYIKEINQYSDINFITKIEAKDISIKTTDIRILKLQDDKTERNYCLFLITIKSNKVGFLTVQNLSLYKKNKKKYEKGINKNFIIQKRPTTLKIKIPYSNFDSARISGRFINSNQSKQQTNLKIKFKN